MKKKITYNPQNIKQFTQRIVRKFAWFPIKTQDDYRIWLEYYYTGQTWSKSLFFSIWGWQNWFFTTNSIKSFKFAELENARKEVFNPNAVLMEIPENTVITTLEKFLDNKKIFYR